jgi:uncharacterized protein
MADTPNTQTQSPIGPECPRGPEGIVTSDAPRKIYYTYDQIHQLIDQKAKDFGEFDYIIAIGGGGLIPARMLRRIINVPIIVITIRFYDSDDNLGSEPDIIQWEPATIQKLVGKRCLIVDEVFDSGSTMEYVVDRLTNEGVEDLSALTLHHKKKISNLSKYLVVRSNLQNYYPLIEVGEEWIVYPWEATDIQSHTALARDNQID